VGGELHIPNTDLLAKGDRNGSGLEGSRFQLPPVGKDSGFIKVF
jgi:hypothetical protein